ncbi:MAG: hypothetical protein HYY03_05025 [Chloroflexi bacterium]|nr:hypothetical protein [Chloroflexota bacterium]
MSLRLLLPLALALGLGFGLLATACGGDSIPDDPRVKQIGFVAEEATYAYALAGPAGIYPYLAQEVRDRCTEDAFKKALADMQQPTGFRGLKKVKFEGEEARITITLIFKDHDEDVEWVLVPNPEGPGAAGYSWYITQVPGIERCGS